VIATELIADRARSTEARGLSGLNTDRNAVGRSSIGREGMKSGWELKKLRDVCELVNGRAYGKTELLTEGKYRVLRVGNFFTNNHWYYSDLELEDKKYCDQGDLLYAWSASFGPRLWIGEKVIYHYHIWKVIPDPRVIDQRYLFHFFNWDTDSIKEDQGAGTTMMHVSKGSMEDRDIQIPPLPDQQRIVTLLDEAFDGIATAKANAKKNLKNARAIFESHLQSVFTQRGEGWVDRSLGELAVFRNGINFSKSSVGEPIKILGVKDFQSSYWAPLDELETVIPDGFLGDLDTLQRDDLVFVRSNGNPELIGRCLLVGEVTEKTTHSGFTIRARLNGMELTPTYLCHFLKSKRVRREMIDGGNGANIRSLNQGTLSRLVIPVPPVGVQAQIVTKLEEIRCETERLAVICEQKLAALDELKKSLLHRAFNGKL
jgi:type I restriction enzyme, S subunit